MHLSITGWHRIWCSRSFISESGAFSV